MQEMDRHGKPWLMVGAVLVVGIVVAGLVLLLGG
jgi:hypothetical protein